MGSPDRPVVNETKMAQFMEDQSCGHCNEGIACGGVIVKTPRRKKLMRQENVRAGFREIDHAQVDVPRYRVRLCVDMLARRTTSAMAGIFRAIVEVGDEKERDGGVASAGEDVRDTTALRVAGHGAHGPFDNIGGEGQHGPSAAQHLLLGR